MRRTITIALATVGLLVGGVAWAEPPDDPVRLPTTVRNVSAPRQVVVERGDHLWKISARQLKELKSDAAIAPYWRNVIEQNLSDLRSGDPDLIYPGEIVTMPEPEG